MKSEAQGEGAGNVWRDEEDAQFRYKRGWGGGLRPWGGYVS
jgi:hypothetical protein